MHALQSLYRCLRSRCPEIHQKRLTSLCAAAMAAVSGSALSVSDLGRGMMGRVSAKHNIKRIDRLLSNRALHAELPMIYQALCRQALNGMPYPLIIVDWSDLMTDRTWQLLRASVAVQGRSVTLYEEIHPMAKLGAREVHAAFLAALAKALPIGCIPVILTDAGFRSTWFELVDRMGWMWIGRVRNRDMVKPLDGDSWEGCKTLYDRATTTAQSLGLYDYVRSNPVTCRLVLLKHSVKGRRQCCLDGKRTRSKLSLQHARSQSEPWLLALCPKLAAVNAESVIAVYAQRMQIEEAFRDLKNERLGMGLSASRSKKQERIRVLLLIGALAEFVLRSLGEAARAQQLDRQYQSNTRRSRPVLSVISLGRQLARKTLSVLGDGEFSTVFQRLRDGCMAFI